VAVLFALAAIALIIFGIRRLPPPASEAAASADHGGEIDVPSAFALSEAEI
jgi:hypothetical protein